MYIKNILINLSFVVLSSTTCFAKENLMLTDFCKINIGIKRTTVENFIGRPQKTGKTGNVYYLNLGRKMKLTYKNNKLQQMYFIDSCNREYKLVSTKIPAFFRYKSSEKSDKKTLSFDLCDARLGMKRNEILNLLGNQTGNQGSGIVWDEYEFPDKSYFKLLYNYEILSCLEFVDVCGREYSLVNK